MTTESPAPTLRRTVWLAAALLCLSVAGLHAQSAELPDAETVIERYVEAVGGEAALRQHSSMTMHGSFSMPEMGMDGTLETHTAAPDLMFMRVELPGIGEMLSGYDGSVGWASDAMTGPRIMEGEELDHLLEEGAFHAELRESGNFQSLETVEEIRMNGEPCYNLRLVWNSGRESHECYHTETGLRVGSVGDQASEMGTVEVTTHYDEWGTFGDLLLPTQITQTMMGVTQVMTVDRVEYDAVDPAVFELPDDIRVLVD